jgi:hypothetical protein
MECEPRAIPCEDLVKAAGTTAPGPMSPDFQVVFVHHSRCCPEDRLAVPTGHIHPENEIVSLEMRNGSSFL